MQIQTVRRHFHDESSTALSRPSCGCHSRVWPLLLSAHDTMKHYKYYRLYYCYGRSAQYTSGQFQQMLRCSVCLSLSVYLVITRVDRIQTARSIRFVLAHTLSHFPYEHDIKKRSYRSSEFFTQCTSVEKQLAYSALLSPRRRYRSRLRRLGEQCRAGVPLRLTVTSEAENATVKNGVYQ